MEITIKFDKQTSRKTASDVVRQISLNLPAKMLSHGDIFRFIEPDGTIFEYCWTGENVKLRADYRYTSNQVKP